LGPEIFVYMFYGCDGPDQDVEVAELASLKVSGGPWYRLIVRISFVCKQALCGFVNM
jgi:hypothetical protein